MFKNEIYMLINMLIIPSLGVLKETGSIKGVSIGQHLCLSPMEHASELKYPYEFWVLSRLWQLHVDKVDSYM